MRLRNARLNDSFVLTLRTPLEPGVRVKKELYKPGRNWGSITLTDYLYILDDLHSMLRHLLDDLHSMLRHLLVSSSHYYLTTSSILLLTTSLPRVSLLPTTS